MENKLQMFESAEFGKLEVLMIEGKPYFPASECATILGYTRARDAVTRHCRYAVKHGVPHPQSPDKIMEINYIPEGDLYRLIIRSKLPGAERFEKWVFDEVLPTIRQHGAYMVTETLKRMLEDTDAFNALLRALADEQEYTDFLQQELEDEMEYSDILEERLAATKLKADYFDHVLQCTDTIPISLIAKEYGMAAAEFNKLLHALQIQYKMGGTWVLYQKYSGKGYTDTKTYWVNDQTAAVHTYWTQAGRAFLYEHLKECGILPCSETASVVKDAIQGRR